MLCSGKSLWYLTGQMLLFFFYISFLRQKHRDPPFRVEAAQLEPGETCSEYSMVKSKTKVLMTCLNDVQNSPGKTLLWTQQQHYTCAFKITITAGLASLSTKVA